ncbi:alpha-L-fucosidase [Chitinivorax tropicus]|uniref:alpha-L-fucosidase n=1 Tax=Chitinivorax tropicus TaxID=714531 RepID=A0A840MUM7_9PROT|nr:alpha-L-fucosidase [Chitinivorax tropicus]MBB5020066.1 alpha-L-fucosidase [Chitinivorax tropicus]
MKKLFAILMMLTSLSIAAAQENYTPTADNLAARQWFSNAKYGLFIHWGPFSIPGAGEWVMDEKKITVDSYSRLQDFFNPTEFNAAEWVGLAKKSGMKYITFVARHHDGFSLWDTKYSDFNIMNTPYKKDILKQIADECHKQGIKLFVYYSLLDWRREDYAWKTGRTGQSSGRKTQGKWEDYLTFMKNQLTEILTQYGKIDGIWFDGHWDQTNPEGHADRTSRIDWRYDEIYSLIHRLQPQTLIGNNHHLSPFPGEDFQMFERDLPGENTAGLSFQKPSEKLPLETCETINNSWGFNLADNTFKSTETIIHYIVKASALGANLLLNIGPMPNGKIQPEFTERLLEAGKWLEANGDSIYNTTAGYIKPQKWGAITQKGDKMYVHVFKGNQQIQLEGFPFKKIAKAYYLADKRKLSVSLKQKTVTLQLPAETVDPDTVVVLEVES